MGSPTVGGGGGWITIPFIIATMAGLTLAAGGWINNLIVYLITEFNVASIDATQIFNVVNGCSAMFPILGAILADSFLGCFSVIWISSFFSLLGIILLTLTATVNNLRPVPCVHDESALCEGPSKVQYAVLYVAITLATIGLGGTRFTLATMGADQLDKPKQQQSFFNWFIFTLYTSSMVSVIAIVYVQDNVSWGLGFGLCVAANLVGLALFLLGGRLYRRVKPQGSPFAGLARVVVAAIRKRRTSGSSDSERYYNFMHKRPQEELGADPTPSSFFKFLNKAALKTDGDVNADGSIANPWKLCTVQQVEDLKVLIKLFPLWSTGIFLATPLAIQSSLAVLQALAMDRHLGHHFKIPAGSMFVFVLMSVSLTIILLDRLLYPLIKHLIGRSTTPLERIGVGHFINVLSMAVSALVESRRLKESALKPMSMPVLWLAPQLVLAGIGEAFHFPGNSGLYYQEFPDSLKSTATAALAMFIGIAFYLSTAIVGVLRRSTDWLPDNIDQGRMDIVFWLLFGIGLLNFGYYLVCAHFYKYRVLDDDTTGEVMIKNINGDRDDQDSA
ncbi:protein NRT1/ PTR FAMILY 2.7-like [Impatiens glandulifera]|uniref:protein NRT1/ PTR FAMILY 2.7-like n=1 Tax=Impatiens glandulifera TaxID=253017 RepID=UPI001FB0F555|nr:protein NRT1/ PTR FAMILY 2.7-like [Impatiens glandulifera]